MEKFILLLFLIWQFQFVAGCNFGKDCPFRCNCADGACISITGECTTRCADDGRYWSGPGCLTGNVAMGKSATQNGQVGKYGALLAVDGNFTRYQGTMKHPKCARPLAEGSTAGVCESLNDCGNAWWQVDLGRLHRIKGFSIFNTNDTIEGPRMFGIDVIFSNHTDFIGMPSSQWSNTSVPTGIGGAYFGFSIVARYVTVYKRSTRPTNDNIRTFSLCEIKVYGNQYNDCEGCNGTCTSDYGCVNCASFPGKDPNSFCKDDCEGCSGVCVPDYGCVNCVSLPKRSKITQETENKQCHDGCGGIFHSHTGVLSSYYLGKTDCEFQVIVSQGRQILLNITHFDIKATSDCSGDFLEIRNGGFPTSPLIGQYCDTRIDPIIRSHSNQIYLKFHSNSSVNYFYSTYDGTLAGCGADMTATNGSFVSPNYPQSYYKGLECFWTITVSRGSTIVLNFMDLELEGSFSMFDCHFDYLEIRKNDAHGAIQGRYCGSTFPSTLHISSNVAWIHFVSDDSVSARGFHVYYNTDCNNRLTGSDGIIESPGFPKPYVHNANCTWVIEATPGGIINASFSQFQIENSDNCRYDYIELRDGQNTISPLIGWYCGIHRQPPEFITTTSRFLYVRFRTDSSVVADGFRLEYVIDDCGGQLYGPSGTIHSPNYPRPYDRHIQCEWNINTKPGTVINITIHDVEIENHTNCAFDYLKAYDGVNNTTPQLFHLCGRTVQPQHFTSTGNNILLKFVTDGSRNGRGFNISYNKRTETEDFSPDELQSGTPDEPQSKNITVSNVLAESEDGFNITMVVAVAVVVSLIVIALATTFITVLVLRHRGTNRDRQQTEGKDEVDKAKDNVYWTKKQPDMAMIPLPPQGRPLSGTPEDEYESIDNVLSQTSLAGSKESEYLAPKQYQLDQTTDNQSAEYLSMSPEIHQPAARESMYHNVMDKDDLYKNVPARNTC